MDTERTGQGSKGAGVLPDSGDTLPLESVRRGPCPVPSQERRLDWALFDKQVRKYRRKFQGKSCYVDPEMPLFWAQAARRAVWAYGAVLQPYFDAALYCVVTHRSRDDLSPWLERARRWRIHLLHCTDSRVQRWIRIGERAAARAAKDWRDPERHVVPAAPPSKTFEQATHKQQKAVLNDAQWEGRQPRIPQHLRPQREDVLVNSGSVRVIPSSLPVGARGNSEIMSLVPAVQRAAAFRGVDHASETFLSAMTPTIAVTNASRWTAAAVVPATPEHIEVPPDEPIHAGFCELCSIRFQQYADHLRSEKHRQNAQCIDWHPLDSLAVAIYTIRLGESSALAQAVAVSASVSPISSRNNSLISETSSHMEEVALHQKASPPLKRFKPVFAQSQATTAEADIPPASKILVD
jgi:hypothetical protein